ncbi:hypothetical protein N7470_010168 [Penicillium chermesinum]|nr:hypothetical protein N7470_010168 [Penicillium chermesinum]
MPSKVALVVCALVCGSVAAVLPKRDKTITIPDDVQWHPETQDICTATQYTDVISFFLGNYLTHAATVVKFPGEPFCITLLNMVLVILFPCLGAGRGLMMILRPSVRFKHPLQRALHSSALVMVIRSREWKPRDGDLLRSLSLRPDKVDRFGNDPDQYWRIAYGRKNLIGTYEKLKNYSGKFKMLTEIPPWLLMNYGWTTRHMHVLKNYKVSGHYELPEGYGLVYVPTNALVEDTLGREQLDQIITPSYDLAGGIIAIIQIFFACSTLYQSRGYQINVYGYAAFGFTVLPYLFMSLVNLIANCVAPNYSQLHLVHTEIMEEAIQRGGNFTHVVGKLESEPLHVKSLVVFLGAFRQNGNEMQCRLGEKLYMHNSTEPMSCDSLYKSEHKQYLDTDTYKDAENSVSALPSENTTRGKESEEEKKNGENRLELDAPVCPILINPACYCFKLAYQNTSSTSILHRNRHYGPRSTLFAAAVWVIAALSLIPIGIMSGFKANDSTLAQRVWLMAWYAVGIVSVSNPFFSDWIVGRGYDRAIEIRSHMKEHSGTNKTSTGFTWIRGSIFSMISLLGYLALFATPAIGRFVVVGQQLLAYGSCTGL